MWVLLWAVTPGNSPRRHIFRQEYVTVSRDSKLKAGHPTKVVIKTLRFNPLSAHIPPGLPPVRRSDRRHALVKTRTTAPRRRQR
ncbi:conserved protein of unknown function [Ectopseudomonas oleovorans]|uniref:Uncharacterized protein n=1 Tax=Ectopseudomonas oleovorans TaxID=301 RepID=A0A653AZC2_ECTOL|nr:conserved protein of unknown function [Pseudomonas oleovorans]